MGSGAEAEARDGTAVRNWRFARTFAAAAGVLSDLYDVFVFGANFPRR